MQFILLTLLLFLPGTKAFISSCPKYCHCSEGILSHPNEMRIYCEYNSKNVTAVPDFDGFPFSSIKTLTLYCNGTVTMNFIKNKFANFSNLKHLAVDNCKTEAIEVGAFNGLPGLRSLKLLKLKFAPNGSVNMPDEIFAGLTSLQALEISRNGLQTIPKSVSSLGNLSRFDATYNSLSHLEPTTLVGFEKMRVIILDGNAYTNLDYACFPTRLTRLSVRDNAISTVIKHTDDERELIYEAIDLSGNKIEFLADNVLLNSVRMANLSSNLIRIISDGALALKNRLDWIDLTDNKLNDIELKAVAVYNPGVNRVRFFAARNPLRCSCALEWMIEEHRQESYQVTVADLDKVTCTPLRSSNFVNLSSINPSDLLCEYRGAVCHDDCTVQCCRSQNCTCKSICPKQCTCWSSRGGGNIVDCSNLKTSFDIRSLPNRTTEAHLSGGNFSNLKQGDFVGKTRLTFLNLSHSSVRQLENEAFQGAVRLVTLDLSYNSLTKFSGSELDWNVKLKRLYLHHNQLHDFNQETFQGFQTLENVTLGGGNRYICDCLSNSAIVKWFRVSKNAEKVTDIDDVFCAVRNTSNWKNKLHPSYTNRSMTVSGFVHDSLICRSITPFLSTENLLHLFLPIVFALIMIIVVVCVFYVISNRKNKRRRQPRDRDSEKMLRSAAAP